MVFSEKVAILNNPLVLCETLSNKKTHTEYGKKDGGGLMVKHGLHQKPK